MQKLERRDTCTPAGAPQAGGNCDNAVKQGCGVGPVPHSCGLTILKDRCSRPLIENSVSEFYNCGLETLSNVSEVDQLQHAGGHKADTYAYVLNQDRTPLMPCRPAKARHLLKQGRAEVVKRKPFTIRLLWDCETNTQPITLGIDPGQTIGFSAVVDNGTTKRELISGELKLRSDISKLLDQRRNYRNSRRSRLWHREPRFDNRKQRKGRFPPSIQHGLDSHVRFVEYLRTILPVTRTIVEVNNFDIQKIKNPDIHGEQYQQGPQKDHWNVREYIFHRDRHACQNSDCKNRAKKKILCVHHIGFWKSNHSDRPDNLITLCNKCHVGKNHKEGGFLHGWEPKTNSFRGATFMNSVRWKIVNALACEHTYGYITKERRVEADVEKSHVNDAFVIAGGDENTERSVRMQLRQTRRNNRSIQTNRNGYKPSIRRQRYDRQPNDLVRYREKEYRVKGVHSYGKYVILIDSDMNRVNAAVKNTELITYGKGICAI